MSTRRSQSGARTTQPAGGEPRFSNNRTVLVPLAELMRENERRPTGTYVGNLRAEHASPCAVVFSCKGGAGSTFLATNLAFSLQTLGYSPCLVDLDLQLGDALAALSLKLSFSLSEGCDRVAKGRTIHPAALPGHPSGVRVLSQVGSIENADGVTPDNVTAVIEELRNEFGSLVIDGVRDFSDLALTALDAADHVFMVTTRQVLAVKRARWVHSILSKIGWPPERLTLIVNRSDQSSEISTSAIRRMFSPVEVIGLPTDTALVERALVRAVPVASLSRNSSLGIHAENLARKLVGKKPRAVPSDNKGGFLAAWRRRKK